RVTSRQSHHFVVGEDGPQRTPRQQLIDGWSEVATDDGVHSLVSWEPTLLGLMADPLVSEGYDRREHTVEAAIAEAAAKRSVDKGRELRGRDFKPSPALLDRRKCTNQPNTRGRKLTSAQNLAQFANGGRVIQVRKQASPADQRTKA